MMNTMMIIQVVVSGEAVVSGEVVEADISTEEGMTRLYQFQEMVISRMVV